MIDDQTTFYIQHVYSAFEDLKQAASQLAGLLVLSRRDPELRRSAEEACRRARDILDTPVPARAKAHHRYLMDAAAKLREAIETSADPLPYLKEAHANLRAASHTLPGFEMVSFEHACFHHAHA
jgi:hypothetical protein